MRCRGGDGSGGIDSYPLYPLFFFVRWTTWFDTLTIVGAGVTTTKNIFTDVIFTASSLEIRDENNFRRRNWRWKCFFIAGLWRRWKLALILYNRQPQTLALTPSATAASLLTHPLYPHLRPYSLHNRRRCPLLPLSTCTPPLSLSPPPHLPFAYLRPSTSSH
jgi:hypothetical protein